MRSSYERKLFAWNFLHHLTGLPVVARDTGNLAPNHFFYDNKVIWQNLHKSTLMTAAVQGDLSILHRHLKWVTTETEKVRGDRKLSSSFFWNTDPFSHCFQCYSSSLAKHMDLETTSQSSNKLLVTHVEEMISEQVRPENRKALVSHAQTGVWCLVWQYCVWISQFTRSFFHKAILL